MLKEDRYDFVFRGAVSFRIGGALRLGIILFEGIFRLRPLDDLLKGHRNSKNYPPLDH